VGLVSGGDSASVVWHRKVPQRDVDALAWRGAQRGGT